MARRITKKQTMQDLFKRYKEVSGDKEVNLKDVARFAVSHGMEPPKPKDPLDKLAEDFAAVIREEIRYDAKTGKPYRANHAVPVSSGNRQFHLWIDIDEAPRKSIHKSLIMRREQMVGDGLQLTLDASHWNNINPAEEPIFIPLDFTEDIEERLNTPEEEEKAS